MFRLLSGLLLFSALVAFAGCNAADDEGAGHAPGTHEEVGGHAGHDMAPDAAKTTADPFAALNAADAALAKAQKTCPVSDENLSETDEVVKYDYQGRAIFFCCNDCKAKFEKDPAKYLAKLDANK